MLHKYVSMCDFQTSFANTSSLLVVTENALDDLNSRVQTEPLPMNRFRPNIVVKLPEHGSAAGRKYPEVSYCMDVVVTDTVLHRICSYVLP